MRNELVLVRTYIEENLRKTAVTGMPYVDLHDNKKAIVAKQNNVVFGRRGSGKSTLLSEVEKEKRKTVVVNLEDYKNISFPNIIVKIVEVIFTRILEDAKRKSTLHLIRKSKLNTKLKKIVRDLKDLYEEDDKYETKTTEVLRDEAKINAALKTKVASLSTELGSSLSESRENTSSRNRQFEKFDRMKRNLVSYKEVLKEALPFVYDSDTLYLLLDDFYFIDTDNQPYLADVLHVLTKGTGAFLKLASIKHRSRLYIKDHSTYQGIEIGHDALEIDLDYSLEDIDELVQFYTQLLTEIFRISSTSLQIDSIFGGQGFRQLCIASGGVARDFLMLLSKCINEMIVDPDTKIGKEIVNAQAASYMVHKLHSLSEDVKRDSERLEVYLNFIKEEVLTRKRTNCFLISKDDLEKYPNEKAAIRDLFDMRFIHLIDKNTSCAPSDGKQYEAYILDVGLYDFTRLRNFSQIEPNNKDDRSRKDAMRASPKIDLEKLRGVKASAILESSHS